MILWASDVIVTKWRNSNKMAITIVLEAKLSGYNLSPVQSNDVSFRYYYFPRTVREWNSLPPDIVTAKSSDIFKNKLSDYLYEEISIGDDPPSLLLFIIYLYLLFFCIPYSYCRNFYFVLFITS